MASYEKILPAVSRKQTDAANREIAGLVSEEYIPRVMPQILTTWDMTTTFVISTYFVSFAAIVAPAGPAALTYLALLAVTFFLPCLIATMQLGVMFPYEGALYNWTHRVLGGYWSFFSGFCAWFPGVLISSSFADLLVTYMQAMRKGWLVQPWQEGCVICLILVLAGIVSMQRFQMVQKLINMLVGLLFLGSLLVSAAACVWLLTGHHMSVDFMRWDNWQLKPDNYVLFGLVAFAYIGTEGPLNLAGEITGRHVIKRHLMWGALILFLVYLADSLSVLIVQGNHTAYTDAFVFVAIVDKTLGKGLGNITAICFMGSFFATILVYHYLYARLLLIGGIDRCLPLGFGKLNKDRVPVHAIALQTIIAVLFTLLIFIGIPLAKLYSDQMKLAHQASLVSQAAATLVWAISAAFLFIDLAACYLRQRQHFHLHRIFPMPILCICCLLGTISCLLTIIDTLLNSWDATLISNDQWWYLVGSLTLFFLFMGATGSMVANSEAHWQDFPNN